MQQQEDLNAHGGCEGRWRAGCHRVQPSTMRRPGPSHGPLTSTSDTVWRPGHMAALLMCTPPFPAKIIASALGAGKEALCVHCAGRLWPIMRQEAEGGNLGLPVRHALYTKELLLQTTFFIKTFSRIESHGEKFLHYWYTTGKQLVYVSKHVLIPLHCMKQWYWFEWQPEKSHIPVTKHSCRDKSPNTVTKSEQYLGSKLHER